MKEITVLMSTYNGEMFIREQIDSILNSKDVELQLLVRDDDLAIKLSQFSRAIKPKRNYRSTKGTMLDQQKVSWSYCVRLLVVNIMHFQTKMTIGHKINFQ